MEDVLPQLKDFIIDYCNKYKISEIDAQALSLDTSIDLDLDIFDIEIDLFLDEFTERFRIDNSKFTWYKYGYPKGSAGVRAMKMIFGYNSPLVKKLSHKIYEPKFRVRNLQDAVKTGRLV